MLLQFDEGFVASLSKLTLHEWKRAMEVASDAQRNRHLPGLHVEPIQKGRDKRLRSLRVNDDLRIIAVENGEQLIALYAGHHEAAYRWASERRTLPDPTTNTVTIRHVVQDTTPTARFDAWTPSGIFDQYPDAYLLSLGVPETFLPTLRVVYSEDDLFNALDEQADSFVSCLLDLASGKLVAPPTLPMSADILPPLVPVPVQEASANAVTVVVVANETLAAEREARYERYEPLRLIDVDDADLRRMLAAPTQEAWIAFLHPSQRGVATRCFRGPAQITGGAGTGKTVVAMHRARHLARQGRKVLLTSFTGNARAVLERGIRLICDPHELRRITVQTVHGMACDIVRRKEIMQPPKDGEIRALIAGFSAQCDVDAALAEAEWQSVIQALGITAWADYRDARRTGRGTRLSVTERERLWDGVIVPLDKALKARNILDWPDICQWARRFVEAGTVLSPFDAVIVDETQDLGPQELRLLAALAGDEDDNLTLVGDGGQRIYPNRTRLHDLGIDVRGRTRILTLNYRTTRQIHGFAERLLGNAVDDLDGGRGRRGVVHSLFAGPEPMLCGFADEAAQHAALADEIARRGAAGMPLHEIIVLAPTNAVAQAAHAALGRASIPSHELGRDHRVPPGCVPVATIHRAKGLEFRVVFVVNASDDHVIHRLTEDAEEQAMSLQQQRNLLYVAVTRAREELTVYWIGTPSRFLPIEATEATDMAHMVQAGGA